MFLKFSVHSDVLWYELATYKHLRESVCLILVLHLTDSILRHLPSRFCLVVDQKIHRVETTESLNQGWFKSEVT